MALLAKLQVHAQSCNWLNDRIDLISSSIKNGEDSVEIRSELTILVTRYNTEVGIFNKLEKEYHLINLQTK